MGAAALVVAAYLCGSLPTGVWAGRWAGVDVRSAGSGNIGATNVARTAGAVPAILTLIGDVAKGFLPVLLARSLLDDQVLIALAGLAAFLGHLFSVFLRFSGGKGVATAFGVFLALTPAAAAVSAAVFAAAAVSTRYVSVASLLGAAVLPPAAAVLGAPWPVCGTALVVAAAVVVRHRGNLSRLRQGEEPKFQIQRRRATRSRSDQP
jgi:glycerol-3-phosphate acyltransferase PlsY